MSKDSPRKGGHEDERSIRQRFRQLRDLGGGKANLLLPEHKKSPRKKDKIKRPIKRVNPQLEAYRGKRTEKGEKRYLPPR